LKPEARNLLLWNTSKGQI